MTTISTISTKGQVVIPHDIRNELGLDAGTNIAISRMDDYVILKKLKVPDLKQEFERLQKEASAKAKKLGIKSEEDVLRLIHEYRGVKY